MEHLVSMSEARAEVRSLGRRGRSLDALARLRVHCSHRSPTVRDDAVRACARVGRRGGAEVQGRAATMLLQAATDRHLLVRNAAAESMGWLRSATFVGMLAGIAAGDAEPVLRASAAEALGEYPVPAARKALRIALLDRVEFVRAYAALSLGRVGLKTDVARLRRAGRRDDESHTNRAELAAARLRLGDVSGIDELLTVLQSSDKDVVSRIIMILDDQLQRDGPQRLRRHRRRLVAALQLCARSLPKRCFLMSQCRRICRDASGRGVARESGRSRAGASCRRCTPRSRSDRPARRRRRPRR